MSNWILRVMDSIHNMLAFSVPVDQKIDFLSVMYASPDPREDVEGARDVNAAFIDDFRSRVWLTYRRDFTPLLDKDSIATSITSDAGWGCSIRVTQMLLAQSLVYIDLGRDWRLSSATEEERILYHRILELFRDTPDSPYSIHKIVATGHALFCKKPSEWFGPTTGARAITHLINQHATSLTETAGKSSVRGIAFDSGDIYRQEVEEIFFNNPDTSAILVLLTHRLGLDYLNLTRYKRTIQGLFTHPFFQGLSSGEARVSAYYFFAASDDNLYYLDPHTVQPPFLSEAIGVVPPQPKPLKMRWSRLNPSLTMGFVVKNISEWNSLCDFLKDLDGELFDIQQVPRVFSDEDFRIRTPEPRNSTGEPSPEDDEDEMVIIS